MMNLFTNFWNLILYVDVVWICMLINLLSNVLFCGYVCVCVCWIYLLCKWCNPFNANTLSHFIVWVSLKVCIIFKLLWVLPCFLIEWLVIFPNQMVKTWNVYEIILGVLPLSICVVEIIHSTLERVEWYYAWEAV